MQEWGLFLFSLFLGCGQDQALGIGTEEQTASGVLPLMKESDTERDSGPFPVEAQRPVDKRRGAQEHSEPKGLGAGKRFRPITCPPDRPPKTIDLVFVTKRLSLGKQEKLAKTLKEEKVRLLFMKKHGPTRIPHISAVMPLKRFEKLFKGEIEYRVVTRGSDDDPICKPFITSYWIPFDLREFIDEITDP